MVVISGGLLFVFCAGYFAPTNENPSNSKRGACKVQDLMRAKAKLAVIQAKGSSYSQSRCDLKLLQLQLARFKVDTSIFCSSMIRNLVCRAHCVAN